MSKPIAISRVHDMDAIELVSPDGARATLLLHGGHLVSWQPAGADEQLYMSPKSVFASGQAIRGGVPVIFPQFAARGPLQRHGFARTKPWSLVSAEQGKDDALAVLRLCDDAATRMFWPHAFELELSVRISGREIQIELACENKGEEAFEFTAALHSYLRVADLDSTSLQGLTAMRYWDSVDEMEKVQRVDLLLPGGDLDRIYHRVREDLTLKERLATTERRVQIRQQGFEDAVVWNPGAEKCAALADMPADGYKQMLCVEAAAIEVPLRLAASESWSGMQTLTLL
ncbi:D-hexose-6-phosphate mutarotase [Roseateles oligotrophus]|uniref:Putative glucose-6-phosphate 1-epimerase n=1 Tax=Roseateles oligotrophus TaxID=1769250 RepID=A0ABT2YDI3_9BURK|nr:D-hexose-6-phosphate mutarotase [Roseateles oligotrophus]MCV2368089.1 D-hexose-6-phosphate mutarotase [Roseateles oligotrophus]